MSICLYFLGICFSLLFSSSFHRTFHERYSCGMNWWVRTSFSCTWPPALPGDALLCVNLGQLRQMSFTCNSTHSGKVTGLWWASMQKYSEGELGKWDLLFWVEWLSASVAGLANTNVCVHHPFLKDFKIVFRYVLWNLLLFSITTIKITFMVSAGKCIISSLPPPWKLFDFYPRQWDIRPLYDSNNGLFNHP